MAIGFSWHLVPFPATARASPSLQVHRLLENWPSQRLLVSHSEPGLRVDTYRTVLVACRNRGELTVYAYVATVLSLPGTMSLRIPHQRHLHPRIDREEKGKG
jgi:hypothetical protein